MDDADYAQERERLFLADSIRKARSRPPAGPAAERCEDCGRLIPEARRRLAPGCTRCVGCQANFEKGE
jgi:phage/conjugal plasmid C-4 type zinc finger TraR family protein